MIMNTIRKWYTILVLLAILLSVVVIGALGIYTIWGKTNQDVVTIMNLTTESKAAAMSLWPLFIRKNRKRFGRRSDAGQPIGEACIRKG